MSKELEAKTKTAMNWYKSLPSEKQTSLVVEYFKDSTKLAKEDLENFKLIIDDIKLNLASKSKSEITAKLIQWGFDETLTGLIVEKIDKSEPSRRIAIYALRDISDQAFEKLVQEMIYTFFLDWNEFSAEKVAGKAGVNFNVVRSAIIVFRDVFVWECLRGRMSTDTFLNILSTNYGYSQKKISIIKKYFEQYLDDLRFTNIYTELAELRSDTANLTKSVSEIITKLDEIGSLLKGQQEKKKENES